MKPSKPAGRGLTVRALAVCLLVRANAAAQGIPQPVPPQPFQFRVNATPGEHWQGGVDMASVAVKPSGSLSFSWVALSSELDAPNCTNVLVDCDGKEIGTDSGESQADPQAVVFARDFTKWGLPLEEIDTGIDPVLACLANRRYPSIAGRKRVLSTRGVVCAWDFSWNPVLEPCDEFCGDFCFMHVVGTNGTDWPSDGPPQLGGPHPGLCNTGTPSSAFSDDASLRAWIDVSTLCSEVWAWQDDAGPFLVRDHEECHQVSFPCAGAGLANRFVVIWNEFDGVDTTRVRLRRIDDGVLGSIVTVAPTERPAAVSVFDDGSFAVFWWDTTDVLDPRARLALYSAAEPPALVSAFIDVTTYVPLPVQGPTPVDSKLTVTVRGVNVLAANALALCVWEDHGDDPLDGVHVAYRLVDPATRQVGKERRFALDLGIPKYLGESWQHTAVFRPDGTAAVVWTGHEQGRPQPDDNVYCTVRKPNF